MENIKAQPLIKGHKLYQTCKMIKLIEKIAKPFEKPKTKSNLSKKSPKNHKKKPIRTLSFKFISEENCSTNDSASSSGSDSVKKDPDL